MRFRIAALMALAALASAAVSSAASAVEQGDRAPAWHAADFAGRPVDFPAVGEGKPVVVVFWATWCPYCRAFMPYLKGIQADYAAQGVKIVAINAKEDGRGDPKAYVQGLGFAPIAVANGDAIAQSYGIQYIPGLLDRRRRRDGSVPPSVDRSARRQVRRRALGSAGSHARSNQLHSIDKS